MPFITAFEYTILNVSCPNLAVLFFSSLASQSHQWYSWGPPNMQCRLCASCWIYWKKYGGLKMPTQTDEDKMSSSQPTEVGSSS